MCQKAFDKMVTDEQNYNFIVSNVILSQTEEFTYNDMLSKLQYIFNEVTEKIQSVLNRCLIRLREDGFLNVLGYKYSVVELNI
ncbi:hypothetical protein POG14_13335 [Clostridium paraputrificum]|uniref:hypothetical protein n=1 Tax=Clostridium paraputrificum TaxID=29363 RepID=UPI00189BF9E9|nr:hypothetical protein [Clostridium paraputrificum]MDC0803174.1 hypothetical protein [Clostridium paraputrificum]